MKQVIFVLRKNQIGYWMLERGCPVHRSLNGNPWCDFTAEYWDEWKDANQVAEGVDALLLSDTPDAYGTLPDWLQKGNAESAWTLETLVKLFDDKRAVAPEIDEDCIKAGMTLVQGEDEFVLLGAESGSPAKYTLRTTLAFKLPKEPIKPVEPSKPESQPVTAMCADSYNDEKALALKIGDMISATITVVAPARGCYYAKSDVLGDLIKIKMSALPKDVKFEQGNTVSFVVSTVDAKRVTYTLA